VLGPECFTMHRARSVRSQSTERSVRYRCSVCKRSRSPTYHSRYPPGMPPPPPSVCRRCTRTEQPCPIAIYEIHHYHHDCVCRDEKATVAGPLELPTLTAHPGCAELPAVSSRERGRWRSPPPPPVKPKPRMRGYWSS